MCYRYVLLQDHAKTLLAQLGVLLVAGSTPGSRYNIPPGTGILAVRNQPGGTQRELASFQWGLIPSWARDSASPVVNARAESLAAKLTFRDAFRSRRCLIPASGFYEWKTIGRIRQPWFFRLHDERPFALAGLWETWRAPDGTMLESCAMVTTTPNAVMEPIHHRMPVMLADAASWDRWLDPRVAEPSELASLLHPFSAETMTALAVSPRVSNVRHDDPLCLATAAADPQLGFTL